MSVEAVTISTAITISSPISAITGSTVITGITAIPVTLPLLSVVSVTGTFHTVSPSTLSYC